MPDLLDDILPEALEEEGPPALSSSPGEGVPVETSLVPSLAPRAPSPASMARTTIGRGLVKRDRLKRLSQKHKLIIGLHLNGESNLEVAVKIGCSVATVGTVIRDPLAQEVIMHYYEGVEDELKALFPKVVGAVRAALDNTNVDTQLKGVDRFAKLTGRGEGVDKKNEVNVKVVLDARTKFVNEIRAEAERVIEVKVEEVVDDLA